MPAFKGTKKITIQPGTVSVSYRFHCTTASSITANDGALPFGTTISSVSVSAKTNEGITDTELIGLVTLTESDIDLTLSYPTTNGAGRYSLTFILTMDNGSKIELDYNRVKVTDL